MFYGWLIVLVAALTQGILIGTVNYSYSIIIVPLGEEFEASRLSLMMGITSASLISGLISPIVGPLLDKLPMRRLMTLGALVLGFGYIALSMITAVWQMSVIFGVFVSLAMALLGPLTGSTIVSRWFAKQRGRALGFAAMGTSVAGFFMPVLVQSLIGEHGWRLTFLIMGCLIILITVPPVLLWIKDKPADKGLLPDGDTEAPAQQQATGVSLYGTTRQILTEPSFWYIGFSTGILFSVFGAMTSNLAPYAIGLGIDKMDAAGLLSIIAGCAFIGKLIFGYTADVISLKAALWITQGMVALGFVIFSTASSFAVIQLATVIAGLAGGGLIPVWGALLANVFGTVDYGRVMGMMRLLILPIITIGHPTAGYIFDVTGSYTLVFQLFAACLVLASAILIPLRLRDVT